MRRKNKPREPDFLDAHGVAKRYGVSVATVWSWLDRGLIPQPMRISHGCSRWKRSTLEAFEAEKEAEAAPRTEWEKNQRRKKRKHLEAV